MLSDNQTAVAYLRNMGGTNSRACNQITRETILWRKDRDISLTITHLPGKLKLIKQAEIFMMTRNGY